ncbi:hypothetical protein ETAE_2469 [Edwardsiella piscicida]|uniref:Uncharacterized protein n=1 Tax=Edwardsiella piscicida TaxID=1263550 RepID=A0AAU8PHW2_EDWPI|nr:hypothetical protein ETAE_2469 [Edwardsiella tarda EIB202]
MVNTGTESSAPSAPKAHIGKIKNNKKTYFLLFIYLISTILRLFFN